MKRFHKQCSAALLAVYLIVAVIAIYFGTKSIAVIETNYKIVGGLLLMSSIPHLIIFFLKDGLKNKKKIPYLVFAAAGIILGFTGMYSAAIGLSTLCLIWGVFDICRSSFEIIDVAPEIKNNWLEITEIVASTGEIIIAILLILDRVEGLKLHFCFLGAVFLLYFAKNITACFIESKEDE